MKKRFFAVLLSFALALSVAAPMTVFAEEDAADVTLVEQTEPAAAEPVPESAQAEQPQPAYEPETPKFDAANPHPNCYCGGTHNGENGHVCDDSITWTALNSANAATYWKSGKTTTSVNLRLAADISVGSPIQASHAVLNIDLAGKTITVTASRFANVYFGGTINVCDSVGGGKIVLSQTTAPGSAGLIFYCQENSKSPTAESDYEYANLFGGTIETTSAATFEVPMILQYPENSHLAVYSGVSVTAYANTNSTTTTSRMGGFVMSNGTNNSIYFGGCTLSGLSSGYYGGAVYMTNGYLTVDGATFANCMSGQAGGVIYCKNAQDVILNNASFTGNTATAGNGGVIRLDSIVTGKSFTATNCTFTGNRASGGYGGVFSTGAAAAQTFTNCTFTGNYAIGGGAVAFGGSGSEYALNGCTFTGNTSKNDGGAVYLSNSGTTTIADTRITDNHSEGTTGGFQCSGVVLRGSSVLNLSGEVEIYGNTGIGENTVNQDVGAFALNTGESVRQINVGALTGDGYVIINPTAANRLALTVDPANYMHASSDDDARAYYSSAYVSDTADFDMELVFNQTEYELDDPVSFDVYAKVGEDAVSDKAYIHSLYAKVQVLPNIIRFDNSTMTGGQNYETVSLYMWEDTDLGRPMALTKTYTKIGTVSGTAIARGVGTFTYELELATSAQDTAVATMHESMRLSVGEVHSHCICGDTCTAAEHTHDTEAHEWMPITAANADSLFSATLLHAGEEAFYYLAEDITVTKSLNTGNKTDAATIHLCLNGHTITVNGNAAFRINNGLFTVCDCAETGTIVADSLAVTGNPMAGRIFFVPNTTTSVAGAACEIYGGTFTNSKNAPATSHGLVYFSYKTHLRIFGGTFDGNGVASTSVTGGGLISVTNSGTTLDIYGGTFQNGASAHKGGAVFATSSASMTVHNALFRNNTAEEAAGAIFDNAISSYENVTFTGNTAPLGKNVVLYEGGSRTVVNTDFGTAAIGGNTTLTLAGTAKIEKYATEAKPNLTGTVTFTDVTPGTVLSAEGAVFDETDASHIVFAGNSTAASAQIVEGALVAMHDHNIVHHAAKAPTCTEAGWTVYDTCTLCDYSSRQEIAPLGHTYQNGICIRCGKAEPLASITAASVQTAAGKDVLVTVRLAENDGMSALALQISYDSSVLTLSSVQSTSLFGSKPKTGASIRDNPYEILWRNAADVTETGDLLTLTFHVSETAQPSVQTVAITATEACNETGEAVTVTTENALVTVSALEAGDANGDGTVDLRDATRLLQYFVGQSVTVYEPAADANGDGQLDMRDVTRLLQYFAGWDVRLGQ